MYARELSGRQRREAPAARGRASRALPRPALAPAVQLVNHEHKGEA